jgi:hypothetical protein
MRIFTRLLTEITNHPRHIVKRGVDFEWSKLWTYNLFRTYELIFGRRFGIKKEMSSSLADGVVYHRAHSWEATLALFETSIREMLRFRFPYRIYIPVLATPQGVVFPSPYLFAIAFDVADALVDDSNTIHTLAHTVTGSNPFLLVSTDINSGGHVISSTTYNSVGMTGIGAQTNWGTTQFSQTFYLQGPSTGANNVVCTTTVSGHITVMNAASYSGVAQTGFPDSSSLNNTGTGVTSITGTTTVVASNCWTVMDAQEDQNNTITAGGGTTLRSPAGSQARCICDSNGTVATGSQSLSYSWVGSGNSYWQIFSMAPAGGGGATVLPYRALLGVGI